MGLLVQELARERESVRGLPTDWLPVPVLELDRASELVRELVAEVVLQRSNLRR
jgi:hypothetical protein